MAVNDIDRTRTQAKRPQTNGTCERVHKTALQEFYQVAFRKKIDRTLDALQADLDAWLTTTTPSARITGPNPGTSEPRNLGTSEPHLASTLSV